MGRFMQYFADGFRRGIIVGEPDFETNNQYADMLNIGNDMREAIGHFDETFVVHEERLKEARTTVAPASGKL